MKETKRLRLLVIEREELYSYMYELLPSKGPIDLLGVYDDFDTSTFRQTILTSRPDVILVGAKELQDDIIERLGQIRQEQPQIATVILAKIHTAKDSDSLRKLAAKGEGGIALFLRQSLDRIEQLVAIIITVGYGQVVFDPTLFNLMLTDKKKAGFLTQLTPKELEILQLLANGYTNLAIAEAIYIDVKTVEHHLNSIYSKLKTEADFSSRHLRVTAARRYLEETAGLNS